MRKLKLDELGRLTLPDYKNAQKTPIALVLDDVRSALNVGSAFRTADAFACQEVVLCGFTAQPPHREILKTALGSTESVVWRHFEQTKTALEVLNTEGYILIAVEQAEGRIFLQNIENEIFMNEKLADAEPKFALIFGNEVEGVSEEAMKMADFVVEIPQFGTKHSLNIAVSIGIVAWAFTKIFRT
ncbi:MAG: RNA methyltransferase [Saprospiraceae bacterium]|nr:RNA methyltransferase [Saprospiraceae bacterium]